MAIQTLSTMDEVIETLGGLEAVCVLTGRGTKSRFSLLCNWKTAGSFPPDTCAVLLNELHRRGYSAPPELWSRPRRPRPRGQKNQHAAAS